MKAHAYNFSRMSENDSKIVLVTGGAGFIGSHLVDKLLEDGHEVRVLDNFSTGRPENLGHIDASSSLSLHQVDIAIDPISDYFEGVDWVFHLAALADIVPSIQQPGHYFNANVTGTLKVVEATRDAGVKRLLYAASSSCYGIPDNYPTSEEAEIRPQYPYALTKNLGEQTILHWSLVYNIPSVCLRLFNVYGPRSRTSGTYGAVFGVFLAQKLAGEPFTVVGDGKQTRDFTYVSDVVSAFLCAAASDLDGEVMNVGSGSTYSVNRLVELLGGDIVYIPKRPGESDCTFADVTKIHGLLNWKAKVPLEEGIQIMLDNIDYWREAPVWTPDSIATATKEWFDHLS